MSANEIAKKFYKNTSSIRITAKQVNWLFSFGSSPNMNGYMVCGGSFKNENDITVFWDATKIKYGSGIMTFRILAEKPVTPVKSDTLILLEAVRDAFNDACDEMSFDTLTSDAKNLITAQRKAINAVIRMNK